MRFQSPRSSTLLRYGAVLALLWAVPGAALADTIYLKNGRVIHTPRAKQVGEKVEFEQFGETVSIPAAIVLRIERDERGEDPALPPVLPAAPGGAPAETEPSEESEAGEGEEVPPESTPEYWRDRILSIRREKAEIDANIVVLRREERAFLFSKRSTAETRAKIEAAQERDEELDQELADLRREARRLGVPPGWLRVTDQTTGS